MSSAISTRSKEIDDIGDQLEEFQEEWWDLNELDAPLPVMDLVMQIINEPDYYCVDFSQNPVIELFFTGASNYFPAILPLDDVPLDQCPIYIIDIISGVEFIGNLRTYITQLAQYYIEISSPDKHLRGQEMLQMAHKFSELVKRPTSPIQYYNSDGDVVWTLD